MNPCRLKRPTRSWTGRGDGLKDAAQKREGRNFHAFENGLGSSPSFNGAGAYVMPDGSRAVDGVNQSGLSGAAWFDEGAAKSSSRSDSRKAASAMIAEIPFPLAQHIAKVFYPR